MMSYRDDHGNSAGFFVLYYYPGLEGGERAMRRRADGEMDGDVAEQVDKIYGIKNEGTDNIPV